MKKVLGLAVAALLLVSGSVTAKTVFFCKTDNNIVQVVEKNDVFTFTITTKGKAEPDIVVEKHIKDTAMDFYTDNGKDYSITLMFPDDNITYQVADDNRGPQHYGSYEVLSMGTSVGFGKCEPGSYKQLITDKQTMMQVPVAD